MKTHSLSLSLSLARGLGSNPMVLDPVVKVQWARIKVSGGLSHT